MMQTKAAPGKALPAPIAPQKTALADTGDNWETF